MDFQAILTAISDALANLNLPLDKIMEFLQPVIDFVMGLING